MMSTETLEIMNQAISIAIKLAAPLLLISMAVGLLIAILQAATQIHEQTITFVPKLLLIGLILLAAGPWMLNTLMDFLMRIFDVMVR
ncbi:MAG: flagellar biosynthesis protein FliQ [Clostridiales bacterium]|nr:flagellar biosynthesis protein FliQ [Clostridiales bacterium]